MPRPPLVIGTWGKIRRREVRPGAWVADARYRDHDGVTRQLERTGSSAQKAEDALKLAFTKRLATAGETLNAESTMLAVANSWYRDEVEDSDKAMNTQRRYREILDGVILPGLGGIRLREISVARMDRFLKLTSTHRGPSTARVTKTVLSGILGMAARQGAIAANPVRDVAQVRVPTKEVRVLELESLWDLRRRLYADERAVLQDLPEPVDFMLGTGERIGETLAVRWFDLQLDGDRPTALVHATAVWVKGVGTIIQEHPKSTASGRELTLPDFLADTLRRRRVTQRPNPADLVFPSIRGTVRDASAFRRQWREWRGRYGYDWVVPHTFRKSVATLIGDAEHAAAQLGHGSSAVTKKHYIPRTTVAPDLRDVFDRIDQPTDTPRKHLGTTPKDPDKQRSIGA